VNAAQIISIARRFILVRTSIVRAKARSKLVKHADLDAFRFP